MRCPGQDPVLLVAFGGFYLTFLWQLRKYPVSSCCTRSQLRVLVFIHRDR